MAQEHTTKKERKNKQEFPDTFRLAVGADMVACALELKRDVETQYGLKDLIICMIRGHGFDSGKVWTFWWPHRLPVPPMSTLFYIRRVTEKGEYQLCICDTPEEEREMFQTGKPPGSVQAQTASGLPSNVQSVLKKFST